MLNSDILLNLLSSHSLNIECENIQIENKIQECIDNNIQVTDDIFYKALGLQNINILNILLSTKYKPGDRSIEILLKNIHFPRVKYHHYYGANCDKSKLKKIIDLLCKARYKLTHDDIILLETKEIFIDNISLKMPIDKFQKLFTKHIKLELLKKLLKENKPDIICLQNACNVQANCPTINYLIKKCSIEPDFICLKNASKASLTNLRNIMKYMDENNYVVIKN